jgi:archaemetzincin
VQELTAVFEARLRGEARAKRFQPALRILLIVLAVALPAFAAGGLTQRALTPPCYEQILRRGDRSAYYLPVKSRELTVKLVPLLPSAAVEQQLALPSSPTQKIARELVNDSGLSATELDLSKFYPLSYAVGKPLVLPDELFDAQQRQYKTAPTLAWLMQHTEPDAFRTVGVTYADIYDDGFNFLFGQARLGGSVCVVSSARMGMKVGRKSPRERYSSIVAHELGHTLGLEHAKDRKSVMAFANSLEEHDTQGEAVTAENWERLKQVHPIVWER